MIWDSSKISSKDSKNFVRYNKEFVQFNFALSSSLKSRYYERNVKKSLAFPTIKLHLFLYTQYIILLVDGDHHGDGYITPFAC